MPVYLVTSSCRTIFQEYIEAPSEDLARIEAMKMRRTPNEVCSYGYGVDSVEEYNGDLEGINVLKSTKRPQSHVHYGGN